VTPSVKEIGDLARACEYIIKELDCKFITINTPQPIKGNWEVDGILFAEELKKCFQIAKNTNSIINHFGTRVLYALNNKKPMIYGCSKYGDNYTATLTVDGFIGPCIVSWQYKETLSGLDNFNLSNSPLKKWKFDKPYYFKKCLRCVAKNVCGGPCPLEVYEYRNYNKTIDHERCRFFKNFIRWAIWYRE
jgi:radical SAM protein with 4Fe4S-binding SPASM domain